MPRFRATVWVCTSSMQAIGEKPRPHVVEVEAFDEAYFKATIQDQYLYDVDAEITFGPITQKD